MKPGYRYDSLLSFYSEANTGEDKDKKPVIPQQFSIHDFEQVVGGLWNNDTDLAEITILPKISAHLKVVHEPKLRPVNRPKVKAPPPPRGHKPQPPRKKGKKFGK
jgi:hypothetical protein